MFTFLYLLQGCNCLYLGIDDDRKEVGTTGDYFGESDSCMVFIICMSGVGTW